jgi:mannose-1-phosphate guanylyltransferase
MNPTVSSSLYVFVMAGGSGERFWPLSRTKTPKHLLRLFSDQTLLEQTIRRLDGLVPPERIFVLTNHAQVEEILRAIPSLTRSQIVAEPAKRDTAPAATLATAWARARDPQAIVALLPADALIQDKASFQKNLADAVVLTEGTGAIVTLGIPPAAPSPAFGYLQLGETLAPGPYGTSFQKVTRFVEKPDETTAQGYLAAGNYRWNAGIFVWKAATFLAESQRQLPALADFVSRYPAGDATAYIAKEFPTLPKISVDYAIMEKAEQVVAASAQFDWDDVGSWTALPSHLPQDAQGNTCRGPTAIHEAQNNILFSTGPHIAICGLENIVVVATGDAVLVCPASKVQDVKKILPQLPPELL